MKRFLLFLFIISGLTSGAQNYNNEWIDYNKTYYKFKVGATGVYRIPQTLLATLGLGSVEAQHFQLWRNGEQVPIYTSLKTGVLTASDYIEFWGKINDGKLDKVLYRNPDFQQNDAWSLSTDTAAFFLSVNTASLNFRLEPVINDVAGNSLPAEQWFTHTVGVNFKSKMNPGYAAVISEYVYSSSYDEGEGYTSADIGRTTTTEFNLGNFTNLNVFTGVGATQPRVRFNASGNAINTRNFEIKINGNSFHTQQMDYFDYVKLDLPLDIANLTTNTIDVKLRNNTIVASDRMVVAMYGIDYPRMFDFDNTTNFKFTLPAAAAGNYLEITNFNFGGTPPVLYDLTNGQRYIADMGAQPTLRFKLLPSTIDRELVLVSQVAGNIRTVVSATQRNFINFSLASMQGDYLLITSPVFLNGPNGSNPIEAYKTYRSSITGGSYNAKVYMVDELVDQFSFGIKFHPLSVRNFIRWARANFSAPVKQVFLVGKGLNYIQHRNNESNPNLNRLCFIPTFGHPASDNLLGAEPGNLIPITPVGRLSVINAEEVAVYLKKVIEYEEVQASPSPAIQDKAWMKNVAHVVGASDGNLDALLEGYMKRYGSVIADTSFGGNVHLFSKRSAESATLLHSARLSKLMEEGISLLTYFGHSSASTLDFNLDDPTRYNNYKKYPVMIVMGCNAGNLFNFNTLRFLTKETLSEKFVLAPDKGSIAFIASTHFGIVHYLDIYNTKDYNAISRTMYGKTLGEQMRETITQTFNLTTQLDYYARFQCEQTSLHGDPAIRINAAPKPDYVIEESLVKFSPSFVSIAEKKFKVTAQILNIGKAVDRDIVVEVKRRYPNFIEEVVLRDTIPGVRYMDSLSFELDVIATRDKGLNKITVSVDVENAVDELYETNNSVTKDFFIYEDDARPIYPYNFSIVNKQNIKLSASTANPLSKLKQYNMELDTTEFFNSPAKVTKSIITVGGVLEFTPGITFTDSTVYYWRVAPQPVTGLPTWNTSSFIYLANHDFGYNQSHYFQHQKSDLDGIVIKNNRSWAYDSIIQNLFIRNAVFPTAGTQAADFLISVNDVPYIAAGCFSYEIQFVVFDPRTMKPWKNDFSGPTGLYGSNKLLCGSGRNYTFAFMTSDTVGRRLAMEFLNNIVPNGFYVVVRSSHPPSDPAPPAPLYYPNVWKDDTTRFGSGNSLWHTLYNQGVHDLDSFNRPMAYIFMYQKNRQDNFPTQTVFSQGNFDKIVLDANVKTPDSIGLVTSPLFGPAKAWKTMQWRGTTDPDGVVKDSIALDIIGVTPGGEEIVLANDLTINTPDYDISSVDAKIYPYIKLRMVNRDTLNYTPYQLRYWRLTYDPVPEGAIAPNILLTGKDTVDVGEPFDFSIAFKNVSETAFDSLRVKMVLTDKNNVPNIIPLSNKKLRPLLFAPSVDTVRISTRILTPPITGHNTIFVEFNSENDQPEQFHFNNFIYKNLYVRPDSLNPLLDVTFDNVHILNRDLVSSKPHIVVKLKDEARWMILDDTSLLTVSVKYPNGSTRRYFFNNDTLRFTPAGVAPNPDNTATIDFLPYFTEDGEYELLVTGKDKSENTAGNIEYRVVFKVINKPMISNMLNYPNPFTTQTAFVFTITGSEVPQNIRIQILTITGKVVREITKDELGPLHIGRNITDFKWDGSDQYGQKLANGIYLYRVITNHKGKALEKYRNDDPDNKDETDKFFNNGYGKMYLMR